MIEPNGSGDKSPPGSGHDGALTLALLAGKKRLPVEFLQELGVHGLPGGGVGIPYYGVGGEELAVKRRTALAAKDGSYWPKGRALAAYGQNRLDHAAREGRLVLVEGETDCWTLWYHGLPCLGLPGSGCANTLEAEHLAGIQDLYVVRERGRSGDTFLDGVPKRLAELCYPGRAWELRMPGGLDDASDLHVADPQRFKERMEEAMQSAPEIPPPDGGAGTGPGHGGRGEAPQGAGLATTCLSAVRPRPVEWLVPGLIPRGKLVMLAGDGGHGKSALTLALAAAVSTGTPAFGLDYDPLPPAEVLLISCEDDFEDTVVPRLLAAGADLGRCHRVDGVRMRGGKVGPFSLAHFEALGEELGRRPQVRLVVIDPAGAYIGRGVDDHKDSDLRGLLGPLAELAARGDVTILIVKHLNRNAGARAVHRVMGSAGYVNAVRAAYLVAPDPGDETRKLFLPLKNNLGPGGARGFAFRPRSLPAEEGEQLLRPLPDLSDEDRGRLAAQLFRLEWLGPVGIDADEALAATARRERAASRVDQCAAWLGALLAGEPRPIKEVDDGARAAGFTADNVKEAKTLLRQQGKLHFKKWGTGPWWCGLGPPEGWNSGGRQPPPPEYPTSPSSPTSLATPQAPLSEERRPESPRSPGSPTSSPPSAQPELGDLGEPGHGGEVGDVGCGGGRGP